MRSRDHQQQPPKHVRRRPGPQPDSSIRTPGFAAAFFQVIQVHTDKPCEKPCSFKLWTFTMTFLPGDTLGKGSRAHPSLPLLFLLLLPVIPHLSHFPTPLTSSPPPLPTEISFYPLPSLPLLGSNTSALPQTQHFYWLSKKGKARGDLTMDVHHEGATHPSFAACRAWREGWKGTEGPRQGKQPGASPGVHSPLIPGRAGQ